MTNRARHFYASFYCGGCVTVARSCFPQRGKENIVYILFNGMTSLVRLFHLKRVRSSTAWKSYRDQVAAALFRLGKGSAGGMLIPQGPKISRERVSLHSKCKQSPPRSYRIVLLIL